MLANYAVMANLDLIIELAAIANLRVIQSTTVNRRTGTDCERGAVSAGERLAGGAATPTGADGRDERRNYFRGTRLPARRGMGR